MQHKLILIKIMILLPEENVIYIYIYIYIYEISYCLELKFVAMNITDNLRWHTHICSLCASLNKIYYIIKSVKDVMSFQMIRMIYYACFQS